MISIFFYFNSESKRIQQSIDSLLNQTSKEFELFIVDGTGKNTGLSIDTSLFPKVSFFKTNLENSISYFSNEFLTHAKGKYVYFMGQDAELDLNFVKKCNSIHNEDITIFSNNIKSHQTISKNKGKEICDFFLPSLDDKIFSLSFLKSNNINFSLNKFNILIFLYKVLTKFNSCGLSPYPIKIKILSNPIYSDLYFTSEILTNFLHDYKQSYFWEQNYKQIEFLVSYFVFFIVLPATFSKNKSVSSREIALAYFDKFLDDNFSDWKENSLLNLDSNAKFKKFKFNISSVEKILLDFDNGK